jgi:hypothetical protein
MGSRFFGTMSMAEGKDWIEDEKLFRVMDATEESRARISFPTYGTYNALVCHW